MKKPIHGSRFCSRVVARSDAMQNILERLSAIADTLAPVVLRGESGAGKEVLARAIHANSSRRNQPFVAVNCAALPFDLLESELFGHAKGAFSGATSARKGLFEIAHGGTLLLDEIAEMPLPLQSKLLRVLQDGEIRRVGESEAFRIDVRIISATHQNLSQLVREGRFRQDLYFRLKVFSLMVPPLRERAKDIPYLSSMFLHQEGHPTSKMSARALTLLECYSWPGNVRELHNAMIHAAVLAKGDEIDAHHLPEELVDLNAVPTMPLEKDEPLWNPQQTLADVEKHHISEVLRFSKGSVSDAARILGIGRTTLWRKMKDYGLDVG